MVPGVLKTKFPLGLRAASKLGAIMSCKLAASISGLKYITTTTVKAYAFPAEKR